VQLYSEAEVAALDAEKNLILLNIFKILIWVNLCQHNRGIKTKLGQQNEYL